MAKLNYRWHLRKVMASRGMYATTQLRSLLAEQGVELSQSQVYRLIVKQPERLNLRVLMALLDILGCAIDDLIEPVPRAGERRGGTDRQETAMRRPSATEARFGPMRPKPARVLPE
ncbi:helix-turn-helix domain-containing protein [Nonomuraea africana]|uniref:DNA-binding Xre family transcriptional regulator n=1 Tax=Nonomuraea africana TaxID=46171 RepID=A0ABR9KJY8_9ACTN|nr:helix-turn-helix transcriptional regulator [Nonomuraea africana]MBE1562106.1 DNA-binding Xre family transcriptional regulator [Nonomuraea africana]